MSTNKRYAGTLQRWYKMDVKHLKGGDDGLGYIVYGNLGQDFRAGERSNGDLSFCPIHTSLVIREELDEEGHITRVETLNSIYDLGEPR